MILALTLLQVRTRRAVAAAGGWRGHGGQAGLQRGAVDRGRVPMDLAARRRARRHGVRRRQSEPGDFLLRARRQSVRERGGRGGEAGR
jgi:hypothetical protein